MADRSGMSHADIYRLCVLSRVGAFDTVAGRRIFAGLSGVARRIAMRLRDARFTGRTGEAKTARLLRSWMDENDQIRRKATPDALKEGK